jgi:hypothetical protein
MRDSDHFVQFFDTDESLVRTTTAFVSEGLRQSCTCIVLATAEHRVSVEQQLQAQGLNPAALAADYQYIALDARLMLATFMVNGRPDQHRFHHNLGLLLVQAASRGQPVWVYGEMVALLAQAGHVDAIVQLEELWNELSRQQSFVLMCGYPRDAFGHPPLAAKYQHICAIHSRVAP